MAIVMGNLPNFCQSASSDAAATSSYLKKHSEASREAKGVLENGTITILCE